MRSPEVSEFGTTSSTLADLTVADGFVGHGELSDVFAAHVGLDFNIGPVLASVDTADGGDHLGGDDEFLRWVLTGLGFSPWGAETTAAFNFFARRPYLGWT